MRISNRLALGDDLYFLMNLACLKFTGSPLPADGESLTMWRYKMVGDKKKAIQPKFMPREVMLYDWSNDITKQIKRQLICDSIKRSKNFDNRWICLALKFGYIEPLNYRGAKKGSVAEWCEELGLPKVKSIQQAQGWGDWVKDLCFKIVMEDIVIPDFVKDFIKSWRREVSEGYEDARIIKKLVFCDKWADLGGSTYNHIISCYKKTAKYNDGRIKRNYLPREKVFGYKHEVKCEEHLKKHDEGLVALTYKSLDWVNYQHNSTQQNKKLGLSKYNSDEKLLTQNGDIFKREAPTKEYIRRWIYGLQHDFGYEGLSFNYHETPLRRLSSKQRTWIKEFMDADPLTMEEQMAIHGVRRTGIEDVEKKLVSVWC